MADLSVDFCGVKSPNPFWLASAPPTNTGDQVKRAFDAGWGGAVWKTLGNPIVNVSSRFGSVDYGSTRMMGLNNIELITDRPLSVNLKEMAEVKKQYPNNLLIASLMVETREEWKEIIKKVEDVGADILELNFGCPHGMCERGMGSAVGAEPKVLKEITSWAVEYANVPVIIKLTPNVGDIAEPAQAALDGGAHAVSLINTVKSIIGVDLDNMVPLPAVGNASSNGGYCGPAVKPIALHLLGQVAKVPNMVPISGIGGIANWRDAAEFMALGSTSVQVCTAVMHYGYRIVEDMIEGLNDFLDEKGMSSAMELVGKAVPNYKDWGDLDLNHHVVAEINEDKCIGCQLCFVACMDGSHQCIHIPGMSDTEKKKAGHVAFPKNVPDRPIKVGASGTPGARVPWVHEEECVGCNLCALVCPVEDCITMVTKRKGEESETWNDRIAKGKHIVPGGLDATEAAREK